MTVPNPGLRAARPLSRPGIGLVCASWALLLGACSTGQLPSGTTLAISPSARTIDVVERRDADDNCLFDAANHVDLPVLLALRDAQGAPIGDAEVTVYVDFAANTYGGRPVLALYDDLNGNGVVDADSELVSGAEDGVARVRTSRYGGDRALLLRANLSCPYRGEMFAFTDAVSATATIEVSSERVRTPDTLDAAAPSVPGASS